MARYDLILLDADGTLLDFAKAERWAFGRVMHAMGIPVTETLYQMYSIINDSYWKALERGEVTKPELVVRRFADLFAKASLCGDAKVASGLYADFLGEAGYVIQGAEAICARLAGYCTLAIATNGVADAQRRRLRKSPLRHYIGPIAVSEEAGAAKPDERFFAFALRLCGVTDKKSVLMVGDMPGADVLGGMRFGIDTCWFNPEYLPVPDDISPTWQIHTLWQLKDIVIGAHTIPR